MLKSKDGNTLLNTDIGPLKMNDVDYSIGSNEHSWKKYISNIGDGSDTITTGKIYAEITNAE